jgi:hypothetical protein
MTLGVSPATPNSQILKIKIKIKIAWPFNHPILAGLGWFGHPQRPNDFFFLIIIFRFGLWGGRTTPNEASQTNILLLFLVSETCVSFVALGFPITNLNHKLNIVQSILNRGRSYSKLIIPNLSLGKKHNQT